MPAAIATLVVGLTVLMLAPAVAAARSPVAVRLDRLLAVGQITPRAHNQAIVDYNLARKTRRHVKGAARRDLNYSIRLTTSFARNRRLTADRVAPMFLTVRRNAEWFAAGNAPAPYGSRRRFKGSRIYFQYYPGCGWQIQQLANFGRMNAIWTGRGDNPNWQHQLASYAREMVGIAVHRAGFLTWEYYFKWEHGKPPWISSITQGTAVQAFARTGSSLNEPKFRQAAQDALGAFEHNAPTGLRVRVDGGYHYLIYPFRKRFLVLNAFIQSLNGLYDYTDLLGDPKGRELIDAALAPATKETRGSDTGAWSLYNVHGRESDLSYHELLTGFLGKFCDRVHVDVFCNTAQNFRAYVRQKPRITGISARSHGRTLLIRFRLSKISNVSVSVGSRTVQARTPRGRHTVKFAKPRKARRVKVRIGATGLAGNSAVKRATLRIRR